MTGALPGSLGLWSPLWRSLQKAFEFSSSNSQTYVCLKSFRAEDRLKVPVTVTCQNCLSRSILGRDGNQDAGHSPFSLQDAAQPRVSPSSSCVQQSRSVSWLAHHLPDCKPCPELGSPSL